jgi:hypothetical protein
VNVIADTLIDLVGTIGRHVPGASPHDRRQRVRPLIITAPSSNPRAG